MGKCGSAQFEIENPTKDRFLRNGSFSNPISFPNDRQAGILIHFFA
jgi:hypothetical protein